MGSFARLSKGVSSDRSPRAFMALTARSLISFRSSSMAATSSARMGRPGVEHLEELVPHLAAHRRLVRAAWPRVGGCRASRSGPARRQSRRRFDALSSSCLLSMVSDTSPWMQQIASGWSSHDRLPVGPRLDPLKRATVLSGGISRLTDRFEKTTLSVLEAGWRIKSWPCTSSSAGTGSVRRGEDADFRLRHHGDSHLRHRDRLAERSQAEQAIVERFKGVAWVRRSHSRLSVL